MRKRYIVSTYDVADDPARDGEWTEVARTTKWGLRPVLRALLGRGYSGVSIAIDHVDMTVDSRYQRRDRI